ncbi:unnamed protein product [Urochloa decumbens]|uniref:Uncharacterized protein n=1 Tax=Urochloa decumbens TaxID=240449 RepID=A0ABC9G9Y2_9POAL
MDHRPHFISLADVPCAEAVPCADVLDAGDAVVRAPGAASAWTGARADAAAAGQHAVSESVVPDSVDDLPDAGDAVVRAPGAVATWTGARADAVVGQRAVLESVVLDSVDEVPDSVDDLPDTGDAVVRAPGATAAWSMGDDVLHTVDEVSDSVVLDVPDAVKDMADAVEDDAPDAVDEVPDIDVVVDCPRCRTFHAGGIFGEACRQARRNAPRCARCGLLHEEYDLTAQVFDGMDNFDCKIYIPVVEELQLDGNTIILPEQVVQKLDEMNQARKRAKANKEGEASKDEASKQ